MEILMKITRKNEILEQNKDIYNQKPSGHSTLNVTFEMFGLKRIHNQVRHTAPEKDRVCYMMINYADEVFNKVWKEGKLPREWKHNNPYSKARERPSNSR